MSEGSKSEGGGAKKPGAARAPTDVVYVHGPTEDGQGLGIVRVQGDRIQTGELRDVKEGRPIHGELVSLTPREEHAQLFDVEVLARGPTAADPPPQATGPSAGRPPSLGPAARPGPALVNSEAFRDGWEVVFGRSGRGPAN